MDSLFRDIRSIGIGAATTAASILVTAWKSGAVSLLLCALAFTVVASARLITIRQYRLKARLPLSSTAAARWETAYAVGAGLHGLILGVWCLLCLTLTSDAFVQLMSAVVTIGCASAIPGRNFGRVGIASVQIAGLCIPLCVGWLLQEDRYYLFLTAVTIPFFAALRIMSVRLQGTLLEALTANNKLGTLAERFDAALSNMPHGLCMLDLDGRIVVHNPPLRELLALAGTSDLHNASFVAAFRQACEGRATRAWVESAVDQCRAMLEAGARGSVSFDYDDGRSLLLTVQPMPNGGAVVLVEDVTQRRVADEKIRRLAQYDPVTGIPNRSFFCEQMRALILSSNKSGRKCALHFIDLDHFKPVNDTLGHSCGDKLLRDVGQRLCDTVGRTAIVGRFGGDEFVVLQAEIDDDLEISRLASLMIKELARPFRIDGNTVKISASIGIAVTPDHSSDTELLLQRADMALYRAKTGGRAGWRFFEPSMEALAQQRRMLEMDLREALETDSFRLHYQPLVDLRTQRVTTCEALLRWPHPRRGMISPAEFIPVAEDLGLIVELGARVLRTACAECSAWPGNTRVSVNLSPVQFQHSDLVEVIRGALIDAGLPPERLEIEITETVLLQNTKLVLATLKRIRDMGVSIVLDDFGTGYSSLSYLHDFPLQKIKLDRSFLADVLDNERSFILLDGIGELSKNLGLAVVVEGVETEAQLALVMRLGHVDEVQGYLLSPPVSHREIRNLLALSDEDPGPFELKFFAATQQGRASGRRPVSRLGLRPFEQSCSKASSGRDVDHVHCRA